MISGWDLKSLLEPSKAILPLTKITLLLAGAGENDGRKPKIIEHLSGLQSS